MTTFADALASLRARAAIVSAQSDGIDAELAALGERLAAIPASPGVAPFVMPESQRAALATAIRQAFGPMKQSQWNIIVAMLDGAAPRTDAQLGLTKEDFDWAVAALGLTGNGYAKIRAVDEVESGGGWFTDVRADILALDGPGGFLDGPNMPKILFEAHWFDRLTAGKFRADHPNISSAAWNRALYVGGQAEYQRLHKAMQLSRFAAMQSASWGRYQIMGFNHEKAGFDHVEPFVEAMKESERRHLEAFVAFIKSSKLEGALNRIDGNAVNARAFTGPYNGSGQVDVYSARIATAYRKFAG